jgi:hypothetical protein
MMKAIAARYFVAVTLCIASTGMVPTVLHAQDSASAQPPAPVGPSVGPPIQKIATASAVSTVFLGGIAGVRELPNGSILVNDNMKRRVLLMDSTLTNVTVVLDSMTNSNNSYGMRPGVLLPYKGDSTLFVDQQSLALLVLDPAGRLTRVRSVWRVQDMPYIGSSAYGYPGFDAKGRIVYRIPAQVSPAVMAAAMHSDGPYYPPQPDSAFIIAFDLETRTADTLGSIRIPKQDFRFRQSAEGWWTTDQIINPLPKTDDWAILPDKRVAFVRGLDYRIEYLNPDGTMTSSEKLPYEWQRLDEDAKKKFVDSVRVIREKQMETDFVTQTIRWMNMYNGKYPANLHVPEGYVMPPGFPKDWFLPPGVKFPENYQFACAPGQSPTPPGAAPSGETPAGGSAAPAASAAPPAPPCLPAPPIFSSGFTPPPPTMRPVVMVDWKELPDYRPPMVSGAVRADEDNNLWIKFVQNKTIPGGPVYDVVNPKGELTTRIQLPPGYTLVGFGRNKTVYLSMRDAKGIHLARVQLK